MNTQEVGCRVRNTQSVLVRVVVEYSTTRIRFGDFSQLTMWHLTHVHVLEIKEEGT